MRRNAASKIRIGVLAVLLAVAPAAAEEAWYFGSGGVPEAALTATAPTATGLVNHDPLRDGAAGLLLLRGGSGPTETDPYRYQQWTSQPGPVALAGPMAVEFWAAMRDFATGERGVVTAFVLDCDVDGANCVELARGTRDILDWSGGWASWSKHRIGFGTVSHTVSSGRTLAVRLVVGAGSDDDMMFAYSSSSFPSRLIEGVADDIVVDCDFSDWADGAGPEYHIVDQGGPDDWASPSRLDVTEFAVATNGVDAIHLLVGFDDVPVQGGTAAMMIDTDIDGFTDYALVATVDAGTVVSLYECDDTLADGCAGAQLRRTLPAELSCTATAAGPWNVDTLVEIDLPLNDFRFSSRRVLVGTMISYAGASLLTSPKDSVSDDGGQDYGAGVVFDVADGSARATSGVGANFVVRRSGDPATVRAAAAHATTLASPFADEPGTLASGESYYYVIEKEGGAPVDLSADRDDLDGTVRLGFDDGDPLSAPVDPVLSTVTADLAAVPADGTTLATVTVVPRDASGRAIGAGCAIGVDGLALAPAALAGPIEDRLDGSYRVRLASSVPGSAQVAVVVEGVTLSARAAVTFTSPAP